MSMLPVGDPGGIGRRVGEGVQSILGGGNDSSQRERYEPYAREIARQYGLPEEVFIRMLTQENGWKVKGTSKAGAQGIAQIMPDTAKQLGVDPNNPIQAIEGAGRYLKQMAEYYKGDWTKAVAAYNWGPGNLDTAIKNSGENWIAWAPEETQHYLTVAQPPQFDPSSVVARGYNTPGTSNKQTYTDLSKPPNPSDFMVTDPDGTTWWDGDSFNNAMEGHINWQTSRKMQREYELGPLSQMVDDMIQQYGQLIQTGQLELSKANSLFKADLDAKQMAFDAYEGEAFKYGTPAGAQYQRGFEPGSYNVSQLGLSTRENTGPTIDPLQMAAELSARARETIGSINIPGVPNYAAERGALYNNQPTPSAPPQELNFNNSALQSNYEASGGGAILTPTQILEQAYNRAKEREAGIGG